MRWITAVLALALSAVGLGEIQTRGPILIHSEADLYGIAKGFGTAVSPYVIEGMRIDADGAAFGILVANFSRPLVLRNLEIYGASVAAIRIRNSQFVVVENVIVRGSAAGILVSTSVKLSFKNMRVEECQHGLRLMFSEEITVREIAVSKAEIGVWLQGVTNSALLDSKIQECGLGLLVELGSTGNKILGNAFQQNHVHAYSTGGNSFDDGRRGNFWAGFAAKDENNDGIVDEPYPIGSDEDRFPLAAAP